MNVILFTLHQSIAELRGVKRQTCSEALRCLAHLHRLDVCIGVAYSKLGRDVHMCQLVVLWRESYGTGSA